MPDRYKASGILNNVKKKETIKGGKVLPNPLKQDAEFISTHMNSCDTESILR